MRKISDCVFFYKYLNRITYSEKTKPFLLVIIVFESSKF